MSLMFLMVTQLPSQTPGMSLKTPGELPQRSAVFQKQHSSSCDTLAVDTFHAAQFHMPFVLLGPNWSSRVNHFLDSCSVF